MSDTRNAIDRFFAISARGSTVSREVRGGIATFFTMAYIVVLNPLILANGKDVDGQFIADGSTPPVALVAAGTAFVAGVLTILMGVVGRVPFAMAAGLGLNAFVTFQIATVMTWEEAMGLVFLEGIIIAVLVLTGLRTAIFHAIPAQLKTAISVGIGLFIALIGFVDSGFVRKAAGTPLELGIGGSLTSWPIFVFIVGLLATAAMVARKVKGAILIGIVGTTILAIVVEAIVKAGAFSPQNPAGWQLNRPVVPDQLFGFHNPLVLFTEFDPFGGFVRVDVLLAALLVFTLLITDFFDTMGTIVGVGRQANLVQEDGTLPRTREILLVDSLGAAAGGAGSVSSNTTYIESAAGVGEGARTGLASVVTGLLFLVAIFFAPLVTVVPYEAAAPALVLVGFLMMTAIRDVDWNDFEIAIPAFLTIVIMPFTYSISNGIGAGFISYVLVKVVRGKAREVHPLLWGVAVLFALYFAIGPIRAMLGL
ncbi:Xanthine/uracil/thiamine/ascorbate permease family protein [[Actinomadura] parvosata subsp. kistnae]|uniref:Permease n=1 Tax=[Actinomadura] parvosata subsp. kistnae TaxID=1909395 RepID=A0A1V0ADV1_9ACTN|nr:NCS2 family permease [Nonomuraea sp. ATCC 55076]AQZ68366.1 permease [Nonomuraea sp. ATCC 55076]SPL93200.1 Xanthine/uracil/thiamine/ascorbate permease family protein [Actinomadura parvosata subsp. kistnae]